MDLAPFQSTRTFLMKVPLKNLKVPMFVIPQCHKLYFYKGFVIVRLRTQATEFVCFVWCDMGRTPKEFAYRITDGVVSVLNISWLFFMQLFGSLIIHFVYLFWVPPPPKIYIYFSELRSVSEHLAHYEWPLMGIQFNNSTSQPSAVRRVSDPIHFCFLFFHSVQLFSDEENGW
jgi:hypothetical protein